MTILYSCGHKSQITSSKKDNLDNELANTFTTQLNRNQIEQDRNCSYDNQVSSLGIGLIITPSKFEIYNDSLLNDKFASWDMNQDEKKNLYSKFFKPEYGIMHFICIANNRKAYKVLVNYSEIKYLPKTKYYDFKTWADYINQSFGICRNNNTIRNNSQNHPLRKKPDINSDTLAIPKGPELFCPVEIKGDWIKVKYDCFYNDDNNPYEDEPCFNCIE